MPRWTEEQTKAINKEGKNIIVSAGAGSGKTAVLSARVLRKVKENTHINNLLILTFTKAAAREMKERIKKELEKERLIEEIEKLEESYITTFDSFSLSLVKKYYYILGLSQDIKVSDEVLLDILKRDTLDDIINEYYKKEDERFLDFACRFSLRDDKDLLNTIIKLSDKLDLKYDKVEYLDNYMKNYFSDEKIKQDVELYIDSIKNTINEIIYLKDELLKSLEEREGSKLEEALSGIESLRDYDEIKEQFAVIGYFSRQRGMDSIYEFAKNNQKKEFLVVGLFIEDEDKKAFLALPNVEYHDLMPQTELYKKMTHCCAIFSLYNPNVEINRLAASNKVYDAMMFGIPVITNKEVINSGFIKDNNIGFVIDYEYNETWNCLSSPDFMDQVKERGMKGRNLYLNQYIFSKLVKQRLLPVLEQL